MSQDNLVKMECTVCHQINYFTTKNKKTLKNRLMLSRYCKNKDCKKHTEHKETK